MQPKLSTKMGIKGDTALNLSPASSVSLGGFAQCTTPQILKGNNVGTRTRIRCKGELAGN